MQSCDTEVKCPLPISHISFKMFKFSTSEFCTVDMCRRIQACADELLASVTEGVVHGVHKVMTRSPFGVTQGHKASGGKWTFHHCDTRSHRVSDVNSPVFLYFWFCYIKSQIFFFIFCFNKYGPSLHYPYLEKKLSHLDIGSLRGLLLFHTKISIIYENGSKFAVV